MKIGIVAGPWGMTIDGVVEAMAAADAMGFHGFYLGDHFQMARPQDSPDPYLVFALVAKATARIRFGPQVTPVTFRPPHNVGRMAAQLDLLSGGRFVLGLGVGWHGEEHRLFGVDYPPVRERFEMLEEAVQVMRLLWAPGPATFQGRHFRLDGAESLPKPAAGRPPILIGGSGERRTLPLVARYADEWNVSAMPLADYRRKCEVLERECEAIGRDPATIRRTLQTTGPIGATQEEVDASTARQMERNPPPSRMSLEEYRTYLRSRGTIAGQLDEVVESLGELAEAGVDEVDFIYARRVLPFLAEEVLPRAADLGQRAG